MHVCPPTRAANNSRLCCDFLSASSFLRFPVVVISTPASLR
jgi:hypothetical protein